MPVLTITLPDDKFIIGQILDAIAVKLMKAFTEATKGIKTRVGVVAAEAIRATPEYDSLLNGELRGELGVIAAGPVLNAICRNVAEGVLVTNLGVRRAGNQIEGGLRIEILRNDYSEVLGAPGASFTSEGGYQIDWLQWLTLEGDRLIVADFRYTLGFPERSRTGLGIMIKGGAWQVPPQYSGTESDNWITRALVKINPAISEILQSEIQKRLR